MGYLVGVYEEMKCLRADEGDADGNGKGGDLETMRRARLQCPGADAERHPTTASKPKYGKRGVTTFNERKNTTRGDSIQEGFYFYTTDERCDSGRAIQAFYEHLNTPPTKVMVLGGGCSAATAPVARTVPFMGLVQQYLQMAYSAASPDLSRRDLYKTFFRTARSDLAMVPPVIAMCLKYNWRHMATLHQQDDLFSSTVNELHSALEDSDIELITAEIFSSDAVTNLRNIQNKNARIIFYDSYEGPGRQTFCEIYEMGLYGPRYQWIIPGWWAPDWFNTNDTRCTRDQLLTAVQYALTVTDLKEDLSQSTTDSGQTFAEYLDRYLSWPSFEFYGFNAYHPFGYDAAWAIGIALNKTAAMLAENKHLRYDANGTQMDGFLGLEDFQYEDNSLITQYMFSAMSNVHFNGVSGPVYFNLGERLVVADLQQIIGRISICICFYVSLTTIKANTTSNGDQSIRVMKYDEFEDELVVLSPIQWQGGAPPISYPEYRREILYNSDITVYVFFVLAGIGIVFGVGILIFNLLNTDHLHIRMSSPRLNNIIILGTILAYTACVLFGLDTSMIPREYYHIICQAKTWALACSFSLSFGAMFAKTWRVHSVFTQMTVASNKSVHDVHLIAMVGVLLIMDFVILVSWSQVDPQVLTNRQINVQKFDDRIIEYLSEYCGCQYQWYWSGSFFAIKGLLLVFGCFLAYETRSVNLPGLNDSKFVGMCVYNVVVLCVVGITVSLVMKDKQTVTYAFQASCMFLCASTTLSLLFIPKVCILVMRVELKTSFLRQIVFVHHHPEQRVKPKYDAGSLKRHGTLSSTVSTVSGSSTFNYMMNKQEKKVLQSEKSIGSVLMTQALPKDLTEAIQQRENRLKELEEQNTRLDAFYQRQLKIKTTDAESQTTLTLFRGETDAKQTEIGAHDNEAFCEC
ncbi:hypothetical protein CAPTEDRAFT_192959 [Capitella teleta]|uniref:Gamma-aminobutyric acid type B receptor subunit 2 n=1 Tax=Capitella teleta TaxID=283909 RepID=R7TKM6_CAPTE|nr:hypothetical protein CAPTEDRAFT_192959 [Capitella teleta]|eukprot:ELT94338.1 hypothetical protein CAPTEDRAFT_192959 [Capitella teleta]